MDGPCSFLYQYAQNHVLLHSILSYRRAWGTLMGIDTDDRIVASSSGVFSYNNENQVSGFWTPCAHRNLDVSWCYDGNAKFGDGSVGGNISADKQALVMSIVCQHEFCNKDANTVYQIMNVCRSFYKGAINNNVWTKRVKRVRDAIGRLARYDTLPLHVQYAQYKYRHAMQRAGKDPSIFSEWFRLPQHQEHLCRLFCGTPKLKKHTIIYSDTDDQSRVIAGRKRYRSSEACIDGHSCFVLIKDEHDAVRLMVKKNGIVFYNTAGQKRFYQAKLPFLNKIFK